MDAVNLRWTISRGIRRFVDTQFLSLPVVQDFLMSFMIGLFTSVFTQRMYLFFVADKPKDHELNAFSRPESWSR